MDYKKLCIELFGTDDEIKLREIAEKINNPRGAGRKRKLSDEQLADIREALAGGESISALAKQYHTSAQVIGKYLETPIHDGCSMRIEYMYRNKICSIVDVDFLNEKVYVENRTNDIFKRAFGAVQNPTWDDFEYLIKDRCFEEGRADIKQILESIKLDHYDPLSIVEAFNGRTAEDPMWMRFTSRPISSKAKKE